MMARAADTAEVEQTALLSPKKLKDHPPRIAPLRKTAQRAGLSTKVYAAITLVLALTAFLFGRLNAPQANRVGDVASVASATDDGVRLTKDEVKALNDRFGDRHRTLAVLQTVPSHLTEEIDKIWPKLSSGSNPYFAAAYLVEKHVEAVLWSFFVELADKDGSGGYSYEERQDFLRRLGGKVDGHSLRLKSCSVGLVDCFGGINYFEYDGPEDNLLNPHYLFEWVAFANTKCTNCLSNAIQASGAPYDVAELDRPKLDCVLGGMETLWEEADFSWPACSLESDGISRDDMVKGLITKYAYSVINQDSSGGLHLKLKTT